MFYGFYDTDLPALRDDFDRADGALGGAWSVGLFGPLTIDTLLAAPTTGGENAMWWGGDQGYDVGIAFTLTTLAAVDYAAYVFVWSLVAHGYQVYLLNGGANVEIYRDFTEVKHSTALGQTFVSGDQLGVRVTSVGADNRFRVYRQAGASGPWSGALLDWYDLAAVPTPPFYGGLGLFGSLLGRNDNFRFEQVSAPPPSFRQAMVVR
jgi:hypothetical protein